MELRVPAVLLHAFLIWEILDSTRPGAQIDEDARRDRSDPTPSTEAIQSVPTHI